MDTQGANEPRPTMQVASSKIAAAGPAATVILINGNRTQIINPMVTQELTTVNNQLVLTNLTTATATPAPPTTPITTRRPATTAFICLPSPSSSPTPQRIISYQVVNNRPSTSGQNQQQISSGQNNGEGSSESDAPKLHAILSSPLPPAYPWNWADDGGQNVTSVHLSPVSPARSHPSSPFNERSEPLTINETMETDAECSEAMNSSELDNFSSNSSSTRRGRPRLDDITSMIAEANQVNTNIRCRFCSRIFPREKSLQAHLRTHTGERPYVCDHRGCGRAFAQSGQLRTHQRLHTGEKPFVCAAEGCGNRFTHANRHCNEHPAAGVRRDKPTGGPSAVASGQYRKVAKKPAPIVPQDDLENSPVKGKKRTGPAAARLRARRLKQELDAADDFSASKPQPAFLQLPIQQLQPQPQLSTNTRTFIIRPVPEPQLVAQPAEPEVVDYVPKKKLAALKLKQKNDELPTTSIAQTNTVTYPSHPIVDESIDDERMMGALALIQLASGGKCGADQYDAVQLAQDNVSC